MKAGTWRPKDNLMRNRVLICFLVLFLDVVLGQAAESGETPRVFAMDAEAVAAVKTRVAAVDARLAPAMDRLRSVTSQVRQCPSRPAGREACRCDPVLPLCISQ